MPLVFDPMFDSADYMLRWPQGILDRELTALDRLARGNAADDDRIEFLLEEAFAGDAAVTGYKALCAQKPVLDDPWASEPDQELAGDPERRFLADLRAALPRLRVHPSRGRTGQTVTAVTVIVSISRCCGGASPNWWVSCAGSGTSGRSSPRSASMCTTHPTPPRC